MHKRAHEEMTRVLHCSPDLEAAGRDWADLGLRRFRHLPLHDTVEPMADHVAMAYFDTPRRIEQRVGTRTRRSITRNDTVTIIPAGSAARWDIEGDLDVLHVYVEPARLERLAEESGLPAGWSLIDTVAGAGARLGGLMRVLGQQPVADRGIDRLYLDTISELICIELLRSHASTSAECAVKDQGSRRASLADWQVRRVRDYLLANIDRQVGLAELAALLSLSPKHVCTGFRRATGLPPHAWMRLRRVERAQKLLLSGRIGLVEIALSVGYESQSAFGAMFKAETGCAPGEWRLRTSSGGRCS